MSLTRMIDRKAINMKKIISLLLCVPMVLAFTSCNKSTDNKNTNSTKGIEKVEDDKDDTEEPSKGSEESEKPQSTGNKVTFSTTDRDGNTFDDSLFADQELTLINFWEPWCGPCVSEIPDLQKLYDNYADQGLLIIGVYAEENMEEDVDIVLTDSDVTYPILKYTSEFDIYQSGYVPTTILVDRDGNIIDTGISYQGADSTLIIGSHSYEEWEEIITPYLGE